MDFSTNVRHSVYAENMTDIMSVKDAIWCITEKLDSDDLNLSDTEYYKAVIVILEETKS